jgi:hypothetical protein
MPRRGALIPAPIRHLSLLSRTFFLSNGCTEDLSEYRRICHLTTPGKSTLQGNHLEFSHLERFLAIGIRLKGRKSVPLTSILVELSAQAITLRKDGLNQCFMEGFAYGPQDGIVS